MFGENKLDDIIRFGKAVATNQVARLAPRYYVRITEQTGRGGGVEHPDDVAEYFLECFHDYFRVMGIDKDSIGEFLHDKTILEYGPGDTAGVALLMCAHGASKVYCVDRFPLATFSEFSLSVFESLLRKLDGDARKRAEQCFNKEGDPSSGLTDSMIEYLVKDNGLSGLHNKVDLVISRAVLEHVNDLDATFIDMHSALVDGGIAVHQVDLKSHGLHKRNKLDFLTWPNAIWELMYSQKGVPNRLRVDSYKKAIASSGFKLKVFEPTLLADKKEVEEVRPYLAKVFREISDEDLTWLGLWIVIEKE